MSRTVALVLSAIVVLCIVFGTTLLITNWLFDGEWTGAIGAALVWLVFIYFPRWFNHFWPEPAKETSA
jgi:ABC-type cobalt transport system substrate-binding protein